MKTLYFDCFSGVSGDMVIGALIDAGADPNRLEEELKKLKLDEEYELKWKKVIKTGITSTKFDVILTKNNQHEHSHNHEHEHNNHNEQDHHHEQGLTHSHDHEHGAPSSKQGHHHEHDHFHEHEHRAYRDIVQLIESAGFSNQVKDTALKIFKRIGEAEGHIHGIPLEKVHFHEVGAVDSIIDIVGTAILIHQLEIKKVKSLPLVVGSGKIRIDHGIYPIPAPATLEILKGVPIEQSDIRAELATPTGAAIIATLAEEFCTLPSMKIASIGYGAGTKSFKDHPNVLRVIIGE